jgi:site-specific DNA recombinase
MAEPSKQVVGYARVSVDAPDKVSPEMQAEAIEAQCKLKGWELVDLIVERGRSAGEGKKRPGLDRARKLIRTGKATGLVVWKIDRCSRSVRDFAEILAELRHHDADFVSVTESFDTSNAMGRAMLQITMVFAELERARMGERAAAWQAYRAKQGGTPTTRAILGYRRVDGQLLLDEQTAPIVKQAVEILLETGSLSAAAGFLRDCGTRSICRRRALCCRRRRSPAAVASTVSSSPGDGRHSSTWRRTRRSSPCSPIRAG